MATSMYNYRNPWVRSWSDSFKGGMEQREKRDQKQRQDQIRNIFKQNTSIDETGKVSFNRDNILNQLAGVDPDAAFKLQQNWINQDAARSKGQYEGDLRNADVVAREMFGSYNQDQWTNKRQLLANKGYDVSSVPEKYSKSNWSALRNRALSVKDYETIQAQKNSNDDLYKMMTLSMNAQKMQNQAATQAAKQSFEREKFAYKKAQDAANPKLTPGEKAADTAFGKFYNSYVVEGGRGKVERTLEKLKALQKEVAADTGFFQSGGGPFATLMPDAFRSRTAIERRDDAMNFANATLKELFGGQLSNDERIAAAKEYWNDALDNESNAERLAQKIADLEAVKAQKDAAVEYYESNKSSLRGMKTRSGLPSRKTKGNRTVKKKMYSKSRNKTKIIYNDGTEEILDGRQ